MPLYEYITEDGEELEELFRYPPPLVIKSTHGRIATLKKVSIPANMSYTLSNQCETRYGATGYYNMAIGKTVYSDFEADKIAESKGYTRASNYQAHEISDRLEQIQANKDRIDQDRARREKIFHEHGVDSLAEDSPEYNKAVCEAWEAFAPANEILSQPEKINDTRY